MNANHKKGLWYEKNYQHFFGSLPRFGGAVRTRKRGGDFRII
jgi:hypothetical protein